MGQSGWPSGKASGWKAEGPGFDSVSALLSVQKLWFMDTAHDAGLSDLTEKSG